MIRVGSIVFRVDDLQGQAEFWEAALGYTRRIDDSHDFILLTPTDGVGPNVSLDRVDSTLQVPPRTHLDLYADDQVAEIERLIAEALDCELVTADVRISRLPRCSSRPKFQRVHVQPFSIEFDDVVLDDLRSRLTRTRWPSFAPGRTRL